MCSHNPNLDSRRQRPHGRPDSLYIAIAIVSLAALLPDNAATQLPQQASAADIQSPGWWTLLPPVVAIAIALIFRSVIPALFIGIWCGVFILNGPGLTSIWTAFLDSFDTHLVNAIADADRVRVLLFTMMLGGMIGILGRNGGMRGIVARTTRFASNAVRGQLVTASLGLVVFFDDIANTLLIMRPLNTLLIGKTMRPVQTGFAFRGKSLPTSSTPPLRRLQALPSRRPGLATKFR